MAETDQQFDYHPDSANSGAGSSSNKTLAWTASEYVEHQRGPFWYILLLAGSVLLAAIVYLLQRDLFATVIILVIGGIVAFASTHRPSQATYQISSQGLKIGDKFYPYSRFKSFGVVHQGDFSSLVFTPLKRLQTPVSAFFDGADEEKITAIIGEHLPYERHTPDKIDDLTRRLRF